MKLTRKFKTAGQILKTSCNLHTKTVANKAGVWEEWLWRGWNAVAWHFHILNQKVYYLIDPIRKNENIDEMESGGSASHVEALKVEV